MNLQPAQSNKPEHCTTATPSRICPKRKKPIYDKFPFLQPLEKHSKFRYTTTSVKPQFPAQSADHATGELDEQEFCTTYRKRVETNQFLKIYADQIKILFDLKQPAIKVFLIINKHATERHQNKLTTHTFAHIDQTLWPISRTTYFTGINQLIDAEIIALGPNTNEYWLNPIIAFNGNRLTLINEYQRDNTNQQS